MKITTGIKIAIMIIVVIEVAYFYYVVIEEIEVTRDLAKEVCSDNDGDWVSRQNLESRKCVINNEIYNIIKLESGKMVPVKQ